ncbi:CbtA family protein [Amycolatopsis acidicola]|uniref:CbtA family protein n=1 Tax=Amycolatopsis acidicola TaxID=2596893 RepID=A0A5N0UYC9_9PSEU|nr:CbtA family protein [Amycolatopsis acidicola]KAA9154687.1 CbtA family protein [Amycolatopsis acidicola]
MEKKLILRGVLAGAFAGLLAFVFARVFAEPQIQAGIDYEAGRESAEQAMTHSGGGEEMELFSRAVQGNLGIGVGIVLFGVAMGALFSVVYTVCLGRVGNVRARTLALLVAGAGFAGVYLVPFLKYPANPPGIGGSDTIGERGSMYLVMVLASIVVLGLALWLGRRLRARLGNWNATLVAGAAFLVVIGIVMAVLPTIAETPGAMTNDAGVIVFPGYPADVLFKFRLYSVGAQIVLWGALGLAFGPLAERLLDRERGKVAAVA